MVIINASSQHAEQIFLAETFATILILISFYFLCKID